MGYRCSRFASSQLSHLSDSLNQIIRIDPFSLLPREVNLRILGYLDAISLGRAAQVNKSWKALADDDLLWRRMCGQHIDRKCEKCGWGLPLLERRRLKVELKDRSPAVAFGINEHGEHSHKHSHEPTKLVTRVEALGGKKGPAAENITTDRMSARTVCDPAVSTAWLVSSNKRSAPSSPAESSRSLGKRPRIEVSSDSETETTEKTVSTDSNGLLSREVRLTRPWKTVYCERLVVERNWRKGRCLTKTLKVGQIHVDTKAELNARRAIKTVSCVSNTTLRFRTPRTLCSSPGPTTAPSGYGT